MRYIFIIAAIIFVTFSTAAPAAPDRDNAARKPKTTVQNVAKPEGAEVKAVQDGDKVAITWALPKDDWRMIIVSRNDKASPKGREKVKEVNPRKTSSYVDSVPDSNKQYWYWLKATRTNKAPLEIGPIAIEQK